MIAQIRRNVIELDKRGWHIYNQLTHNSGYRVYTVAINSRYVKELYIIALIYP